jgi:hypothetical protein
LFCVAFFYSVAQQKRREKHMNSTQTGDNFSLLYFNNFPLIQVKPAVEKKKKRKSNGGFCLCVGFIS